MLHGSVLRCLLPFFCTASEAQLESLQIRTKACSFLNLFPVHRTSAGHMADFLKDTVFCLKPLLEFQRICCLTCSESRSLKKYIRGPKYQTNTSFSIVFSRFSQLSTSLAAGFQCYFQVLHWKMCAGFLDPVGIVGIELQNCSSCWMKPRAGHGLKVSQTFF